MNERLTTADIAERFGVDVRTVRERWVHQPGFPPPIFAPSPRRRQWLASEVDAWATPAVRRSEPQTL